MSSIIKALACQLPNSSTRIGIRLRDLNKKIIKSYRIKITSQHSGPIDAAIRFFLQSINRRDLDQGMRIDILERPVTGQYRIQISKKQAPIAITPMVLLLVINPDKC